MWSPPVLVSFGYSQPCLSSFPRLRDTTLSARYEQYQGWGWLTTGHFIKYVPGLCILRDTSKCTNQDGYYTVTLVALWILLISRARSWYLSDFSSSVVRMLFLVRWHCNVDKCSFPCVLWCSTVSGISDRLCFSRLFVKTVIYRVILTGLFYATERVDGRTTFRYTLTHTFLI